MAIESFESILVRGSYLRRGDRRMGYVIEGTTVCCILYSEREIFLHTERIPTTTVSMVGDPILALRGWQRKTCESLLRGVQKWRTWGVLVSLFSGGDAV